MLQYYSNCSIQLLIYNFLFLCMLTRQVCHQEQVSFVVNKMYQQFYIPCMVIFHRNTKIKIMFLIIALTEI